MARMTMTLTSWKIAKLPSQYFISGYTNAGVEISIYTVLSPIDRGSHYIIQNVTRTLDIYLYRGEGEYVLGSNL